MTERLIPYQPMDLAEPADLVAAIRQRRGGQFINLDRMLLHSVPIAEGWNHFIGEIRNNLSLDPKLRELAMCGVAVLNGAEYEFFHHAPPFIATKRLLTAAVCISCQVPIQNSLKIPILQIKLQLMVAVCIFLVPNRFTYPIAYLLITWRAAMVGVSV